ncbi:MAG: flagellar hook-length control protein FliK [Pseudomonadota bacterium]
MNLENLFTLRIVSENATTGKGPAPAALLPPGAVEGGNFFDMFLAQVTPSEDSEGQNFEKPELLRSNNPLLEEKPKLDITRLLAENEEIEKEIEAYAKLLDDELPQVIALNQKAFEEIIKPLQKDGTLSFNISELESLPPVQELNLKDIYLLEDQEIELSNKIKALIQKIETLTEGNKPQLIVTNLTPEDLSTLKSLATKLEAMKAENGEDIALDDLDSAQLEKALAGLVQLVQKAEESNDNELLTDGSIDHTLGQQGALKGALETLKNSDTKASTEKINQLVAQSGFKETNAAPFKSTMSKPLGNIYGHQPSDLNSIEPKAGKPSAADADAAQPKIEAKQAARNAAGISIPLTGFNATDGLSLISTNETGSSLSELVPLQQGFTQAQAMQANTSAVVQAQGAHAPHPTTQAVAATLKNAAAKGQDTQISVQLDPPDLGKVDIEMRFNKEKGMKALLTIEKPETWAMLQRDAHALERALQDAGIELSGDALSFDLAGEGYDFNHNGQHDSHGPHGKSPNGEDEGELIALETTLDWYVDPETGHTHYSILA